VFPTHSRVRRRVVQHARQALAAWEGAHVGARGLRGTPADFRALQSTWASYQGHFRHANARRLTMSLHRRFAWLASAARPRRIDHRLEGKTITIGGSHVSTKVRR
jgi:RNA-directed DNA polymerase